MISLTSVLALHGSVLRTIYIYVVADEDESQKKKKIFKNL